MIGAFVGCIVVACIAGATGRTAAARLMLMAAAGMVFGAGAARLLY